MNYFRCGGGGSKKQPEGCIYNFGPCAFNTGYIPNANTKIIMKAVPSLNVYNNTSGYITMFSSTPNGDGNKYKRFGFESSANNRLPRYWRAGETASGSAPYDETNNNNLIFAPLIFEAYGRTIKWYFPDDEQNFKSLSIPEETGQIEAGITPIALFGKNYAPSAGNCWVADLGQMALYFFDVYENDVLLHHFIPAYNNNQYCLYDTVDGVYIYDLQASGANVRGFVPAT